MALVPTTPVGDIIAVPVTVTDPTALVPENPVTLMAASTETVPTAEVPATPVTGTLTKLLPKPAMEVSAKGAKPNI